MQSRDTIQIKIKWPNKIINVELKQKSVFSGVYWCEIYAKLSSLTVGCEERNKHVLAIKNCHLWYCGSIRSAINIIKLLERFEL